MPAAAARPSKTGLWILSGISLCALVLAALSWWKLSHIQETLARQTADSGSVSLEARASAKQAQELARDTAARLAVNETRWSEVALQRSQLEELMQSLSRSRDENLVVDIESALRLALQQAQLTGSVQPLVGALKSAQQRLSRVAQPRLSPVLRALTRDLERVQSITVTDTPALLVKFDELVRMVDELPLANAVGVTKAAAAPLPASPAPASSAATALGLQASMISCSCAARQRSPAAPWPRLACVCSSSARRGGCGGGSGGCSGCAPPSPCCGSSSTRHT